MKKLQRGLPKGRYSKYGYKRNSPDVNKPFNIIPSGNITMKDVDFPVKGIDNLGNEQIMYPGLNYIFPGSYVLEIPMMQPGGQSSGLTFQQYYTPAAESTGANYTPTMTVQAAEKLKAQRDAQELARRRQAIQASQAAASKPLRERLTPENLAQETGATGDKLRFFPNDPDSFIDDYLNPLKMVGDMASGLGRIPLNVKQGNYGAAALDVAIPVATGALAGLGAKSAGQFVNNLTNPLAGTGQFLTTKTPLKNAYKYNPWAFKPNSEAYYRVLGKEGLNDALESGVIRANPKNIHPFSGEPIYDRPYFSKGVPFDRDWKSPFKNKKGKQVVGSIYPDETMVEVLGHNKFHKTGDLVTSPIGVLNSFDKGINFYKRDWLRGYKEVPKPKQLPGAGDLAANAAAKSSFFGDIASGLQDFGYIIDQSLGHLFNNRANKKAIAEGNEWLRNWIQHPTTQAKIDKDFAGKINNSFVKNIYDVGYEQAKNFTPVSTELPLSVQLAKNFYPNKGNWGVSYLHHVDPMRRRMIEQGQMDAPIWHGSFISKTLDLPYKKRVGTTIHEGTHDWTNKFGLEASGQREFLERNINPEIHQDLEYWRRHGDDKTKTDLGKKRRYQAYLADPTEQHARIMELRKYLGHTPDFVSTPEYAQKVMDYLSAMRKNKRPIDSEGLFKVIDNDPQKLSNMFNRLWGVTPVAVAGAAAASEKKDGGMMQRKDLPKAQSLGEFIPSWANPMNWNVEDYSNKTDFNKAYSAAKKAGKKEFMFNGKRYNTKYAGTPRQEVGVYGVQGKPVHHMNLNDPAQVNLYPAFGKYLPGHISASIGDNQTSVDYSRKGNYPYGINKVKNKGEKSFNVYGQDNLTFSNKVASLPTGNYFIEDKYRPSDWNLFTNNCADNVCDAFGIPRSKGIQTPKAAMQKIQKKYPTLDVTGRRYDDYYDLGVKLRPISFHRPDEVLNQTKNLVGILSSPDLNNTKASEKITFALQNALLKKGYKLPKSINKDGELDGILGDETKAALEDWQKKNSKKQLGGALLKAQFGAFGTIPTSPPFMPQKENVVTSKKVDNLPKIKVNTTVPDEMITIKDGRKIRLTTGQAVNPNTDLVGKSYPTKTLRSILDTAKNKGLSKDDALTLAAMDLQETRWGETDESIGHVLHGNDFAKSPVENFINAYLKSKETADRLKLSDEYTRLQVYNGLGTVTPDTEKDYHGFRMKKIYGVPVPASGINMRKNPLYGKQIVDIRDNVLKQNPEFLKLVDEYYKMGGVTNEMLDVYKNYINGVYTNTEKEKDAIKIYDKLNRKYYREAKNANKSVPNYIMSLIK